MQISMKIVTPQCPCHAMQEVQAPKSGVSGGGGQVRAAGSRDLSCSVFLLNLAAGDIHSLNSLDMKLSIYLIKPSAVVVCCTAMLLLLLWDFVEATYPPPLTWVLLSEWWDESTVTQDYARHAFFSTVHTLSSSVQE